ncbi:MAG: hypothetical protein HXX17_00180, partial [Geobacteraceae bacterium]|nr:hypothetical protein [Geobacteraceae bacterium]
AGDNGAHPFTNGATLITAAGQTITATDTVTPGITGGASITVNPAVATHFTVTSPATITAGAAFSITVTARDTYNNIASGYTGIVHFTTTDASVSSLLPANYTFLAGDNGAHTFTNGATLITAAGQTVTATDTVSSGITGGASVTVNPAAANHFTLTAPAATTVGAAFSITVTARDAFNNIASGYTGTVHFTKTDSGSGSLLPANYTFIAGDNGVHTFTNGVTLVTSSSQTITATDTITSSITGGASVTVASAPIIAKLFGAASIPLNGTTSLTFNITNPPANSVALSGIAFTDNLPAGLVIATPSGLSNNCGGTAAATAGSGSVALSAGALAVSSSCTVSVNVTGTTTGVKNNSVQVTSTEGGTGNTSNASITVVGPPVISKAFGAASIPLNGSTSLSFTIQNNNSTTTLTGIGFSDTLPVGLVVATPNGLSGTCGGGSITAIQATSGISLSNATIAQSSSCTFSLNVTSIAAGQQNNTTGAVTSTEGATGNTASATVIVVAPPSIAKAFGAATIPLNSTTSLTFTITNPAANTIAQTGVAFSDTLPSGLVVATPNGLSSSCGGTATAVAGSGSISLSGGTIAANSSCTVTVNVTGIATGTNNNTSGNVSSTNGGTGNRASASITVMVGAPTATAASAINFTGFTANWNAVTSATKYYLDVATDSGFTGFVTGYNNLDVGNVTTRAVTGLTVGTPYFYRVRAYDSAGTGADSNPISLFTAAPRTVTSNADSGSGSLRDAIANANPGDVITFDAGLSGQTINLASTLNINKDQTINGPGAANLTISGGGTTRIFQVSGTTVFTLQNLTLANGAATSGGALIDNAAATTTISGCLFSSNTATNSGGAISASGVMTISDTLFSGNSAITKGGAIFNNNATLSLTNVTLSGNSAANGGGFYNAFGTATIVNGTIAANSAAAQGGGIDVLAGIVNLKNSIVANNTAPGAADIFGTVISQDYNLVRDVTGAIITGTTIHNLTGSDPKLGSLANNSGPTFTMALLFGSPAIDAGTCTGAPTADQRGMTRGSACDMGAYERGDATSLTATGGTPQSTTISTTFSAALAAKATDSLGGPLDGISVAFAGPASGAGISAGSIVNTDSTGVASFTPTANASAGGPYTVTATAISLPVANFSLTNSMGDSTISAGGGTSFTYNGLGQGPAGYTVTGSTGTVTLSYSGTGSTSYGPNSAKPSAAGTYALTASVAADSNYNGATSAPFAFTINKADTVTTVICATGPFSYTGTPQTPCSATVTGAGGLSLIPTPLYTSNTNTGPASASYSYAATANYNASSDTKSFTIGKATLTVTADNKTKLPGTNIPALTASYSGFANNETVANISGAPFLATAALKTSPVGDYDITIAAGTLASSNYDFTLVKGKLTIAYDTIPPSLTISTLSDNATSSTGIINVSGTATAAINGLKSVTVNGTAVTVSSAGSFSYPVLLLPGINSISAVATDNADLTTTVTRHITLDATAPLIRLSGDISDNSVTHVADHILTGNVFAAGTTVTVSLNGGTATAATVPAGGDTFTSPVTLAAGLNTIEIFATDSHGKTSSIKISATLNTALSLDMTQPANDLKIGHGDMTLSGTVSGTGTPPFTVTVRMDGQTFTPTILGNGTFNQALHFASEKTYPITVTASDTSGNSVTAIRNVTYALLGDQNGNGSVTIEDVIKAYRIDKGLDPAAGTDMLRLDVAPLDKDGRPQGNGIIDLGDVILLLRYIAGVIIW